MTDPHALPIRPLPYDPDRLAEAVCAIRPRLLILFGSWATASPPPGPESDVDMAILGCPKEKFWECHRLLSAACPEHELDLVRLEDADPLFRDEVMRQGILLAGDPDQFCDDRAYAYRDFVDSADRFALEQTLFEKKMANLKQQIDHSC